MEFEHGRTLLSLVPLVQIQAEVTQRPRSSDKHQAW